MGNGIGKATNTCIGIGIGILIKVLYRYRQYNFCVSSKALINSEALEGVSMGRRNNSVFD